MRASAVFGALLVILGGVYTLRVTARPLKVDYHSGICQRKNNTGTIVYKETGISVAAAMTVVCPLEHITFADDTTGTSNVTFRAWVQATNPSDQGTLSTCALVSNGTTYASIPSFTTVLTPQIATGTAPLPVPTKIDGDPIELHVMCDFKGAATLGSMQVKML